MKKSKSKEKSLSQKVARGGFWVFSLKIIEKILGIVRLIILARILSPNDFGLFGIALLTMSVLETFSQTGFHAALVQKKESITNYLDTAWTVSIIRGFILFILLFLAAPYVALFFNSPEASLIIQVIGVSILFRGFTNIGIIYFQKELEFNKQFVYRLSTTMAEFIVAISAVLILRNVWALVYGGLASSVVGLIASYLVHPYRPHFNLNLGKAKELFGFGKWVLGSSILILLITQGDDAFVGKFLGITMLGFYQLAYRISNMPATEITHVISQVTFPAYSKLQSNLPGLREAYLKTLQLTAFMSIPLAGGIFILAPELTTIFLSDKWMPMVPAMQIFCILGALRSIAAASGPIFLALGRPDIEAKLPAAQLALLAILIYPLTVKWGITGTAASVSIVSCSFIFIILSIVIRLVKMEKSEILNLMRCISFPLLAIIPLFPVKMFILKPLVGNDILLFFMIIAAGIFIYSIVVYILDRYSDYNMVANLKYALKTVKA